MTLPRWYATAGFIAAVGAAVTFLAAAYGWLGGSLWRFLDPPFEIFLILVFLWLLALPFFPRLSRKQRLLGAGSFLVIFVLPALAFQSDFYRLFVPSALFLRSFYSNPFYLVVESAILIVLLTLVTRIFESGEPSIPRRRQIPFLLCLFLTLFSVPILASLDVADAIQRAGYRGLLSLRGEHSSGNAAAVVFQVQNDQISRDHFLQLVKLFEDEKPAVIGVVGADRIPVSEIDSLSAFGKIPMVFEYGSGRLDIKGSAGVSSADRQAGMFGAPLGFPMYFQPFGKSGIDFSVKLAHRYLGSRGEENDFRTSASSVSVGRSSIPVIDGRKALINHYWKYDEERGRRYARPGFRTLGYQEFEEDGPNNLVWDSDNLMPYFVVNYSKRRFEAPIGKEVTEREGGVTWKRREFEPALIGVGGKILIIEFKGMNTPRLPLPGMHSDAHVVASIAQSILDGDFVRESKPMITSGLAIVLVILVWLAYRRWGAFLACGFTLAGGILIAAGVAVAFTQWGFLLNLYPLGFALAGSLVVFFPVGVVSERQAMMKERTRLNAELQAARDMQMGLMPKEDPIVAGFDIAGICVPANEVGGDFFDYVWLDERKTKLGIAVADVSGKAMRAAITAVMTSGMIYQEIGNGESPKKLLRKINKPLYMKIDDRMFTALSFGVLDTKRKELRFSNAGQMYPALNRKGRVIMLEVKGARLPLGIKENVLYEEMAVKLKKGDTVIFYTDGIPEAKNEKDEFYGFERFKALAGRIEGMSAKETRDRILNDAKSFTGKSPQYDDMTVVVLRVN